MNAVLQLAPRRPGVYRFWDNNEQVLYVGKALNLLNRIRSHLLQPDETPRHKLIIDRSETIDWIVTPNDVEALLLEDTLIKRHKPTFNVRFRDDKRYPILRLDMTDDFPTLSVVRRAENDGALYYGPYTSSRIMRTLLRVVERYFPLRRCSGPVVNHNDRECMNFQIKKCPGVCSGHVNQKDYASTVHQVQMLLAGRNDELVHLLELEMRDHAENLNFEAAAIKRDQLKAVQNVSGGRRLLLEKPVNIDVFAFDATPQTGYAEILLVRSGMIAGSVHLHMDLDVKTSLGELAYHFITHYYHNGAPVPKYILTSNEPDNRMILESYLKSSSGRAVTIKIPRKGIRSSLLRLANSNLQLQKQADIQTRSRSKGPSALKKLLNLRRTPIRIEAIDISESQGKNAVGSVISFANGKPERDRYRRFRIKDADANSDTDRIREVFRRRLKRSKSLKWNLPDLFLIDGGKPQLNSAIKVAADLGHQDVTIISLAKARNNREREGIFLSNGQEFTPPPDHPAVLFLDAIRDEAHRFAITYHRELRARSLLRSRLMDIPGIGPQKRKQLLDHFTSIENILVAEVEDITKVDGFGRKTAQLVYNYLKRHHSRQKKPDSPQKESGN